MQSIGGGVIGFSVADETSVKKGESLWDTIKTIGLYSDLIVIRHPKEGSAKLAASATNKPVINAGDGANEHPTQTLLDLFTIKTTQGKLDKLNIAFVGDLRYGRTVHSLAYAMRHFDNKLYFISPPSLTMPEEVCNELRRNHISLFFPPSLEEVMDTIDILYMTRIQKERFSTSEVVENQFFLTPKLLEKGRDNLKILHPLPRLQEIDKSVDKTPYAHYFTQAQNGLYVRQALLTLLLGKNEET